MYVRTVEGLGQVQKTINLGRSASLNHWHTQSLGQQPTPTTGAGTTASKGNNVVGGPILLDRFRRSGLSIETSPLRTTHRFGKAS